VFFVFEASKNETKTNTSKSNGKPKKIRWYMGISSGFSASMVKIPYLWQGSSNFSPFKARCLLGVELTWPSRKSFWSSMIKIMEHRKKLYLKICENNGTSIKINNKNMQNIDETHGNIGESYE
jgi:hypothetical protein